MLTIQLVPVSAFSDLFAKPMGDYSLWGLMPTEVSLGFPVFAVRENLNSTSGFTEPDILADPTGQRIRQTTLEIIRGISVDYYKAKAIHEWVHRNIKYDHERAKHFSINDSNSSALRTFNEKKAICEGYNYLTALMLYFAGIPSADIGGISRPSQGVSDHHAWLAAYVDNKWIYLDPTWGKFDIAYNYHQNIQLIRYTSGYYTFEWLAYNNAVGIRVLCVFPRNVTEATLPFNYDNTNVHIIDIKENNVTKIIIPDSFPLNEASRFISAFRNAEEVELTYNITSIPKKAFSGNKKIKRLIIPDSVVSIDVSAFEGIPDLTIHCMKGSYAETYAKANNIPYVINIAKKPVVNTAISSYDPMPSEISIPNLDPIAVFPTISTLLVNGRVVAFESYNIGGYYYFKLRDIAAAINETNKQFSVDYDSATMAIHLTLGKAYVSGGGELLRGDGAAKAATPVSSIITLFGNELKFTVYNISDNNYFRLRDLMKVLNIAVTYDEATKKIGIDTSNGYVE